MCNNKTNINKRVNYNVKFAGLFTKRQSVMAKNTI